MARPQSEIASADAIRALIDDQGRLVLRVTPGARREAIELGAGALIVRVRARPEGGKANAAVLDLVAQALGIATSRLHLLRGATGRDKVIAVGI